ncbi:DUF4843 domain-containing protein [Flavobacterium chilense]|uniref:DUF4843 domain-containing protein n=1 Tax=Flavobacterium chilense TaxID=946677 RepID=A0A1M6X8Z6_9FLAO|nr:DUF4843 domain-containing protein [Flavobacterium chilense]SHL02255.1 protein of unknown function [Flavobacterium chilense]
MKKILILSIVLLSFLGVTSCSQEEIKTYSGTDNVYFSPAVFPYVMNGNYSITTDSTGVSFGFDNAAIDKKTYLIPIRVQGKLSDIDRKVKVTVDPSSTAIEGTDFSLPKNIMIRAGKAVDTIAVTLYRTSALKLKRVTMVLNLEENEFFTTKMQSTVTNVLTNKTMSYTRFKLSFDDQLNTPKGWYVYFTGPFTAKKFLLMCDLLHLDPVMFDAPFGSPGIGSADYLYYNTFMKRYLADQKASGNTIYEDDGTEMVFP